MPSVVFDVKTSSGEDIVDTRVEMDGKLLRERLDGRPVSVDPGEHTLVFTARGHSQTIHVLVQEGIVDRPIAVTIGSDAVGPPPPPLEYVNKGNAQRAAGLALGGAGLFGIALGASFGGIAIADHSDVASVCPNNTCNGSVPASIASKNSESLSFANASTITFIVGAVLFAAGIVLYVTAPHRARVGLGPGGVIGTF